MSRRGEGSTSRRARGREATRDAAVESLDLRTRDGWSLRADVHSPVGRAVGVVVLAHDLMARRTQFYRPRSGGVATFLVDRGWRVVAFDFRGHGDSQAGPHATAAHRYQGYDDFVARDLAAVCEFAREHAVRGEPVAIVGHGLGGHAALAAQGTGAANVDAIVGVASAPPFLCADDASRGRRLLERVASASMLALARRVGRFPARALGIGSDDETLGCCEDLERFARTGRWISREGRDYAAALENVRVPVLQVVSTGDRFASPPACADRLVGRCRGPRAVVRVTGADDGGPAPSHTGLVTSPRVRGARGVWDGIDTWLRRATTSRAVDVTAQVDADADADVNKRGAPRPSERSSPG